jgi:hypothetical protein
MAAVIAVTLYKEIPRVAFETERQKEQLLIERGEQYKRAIQLFLRANKNTRWPASVDELESFNNQRFLRHRYKDPMTGKEEWRLIHIQNGVLTDSVNNKGQKQGDQKGQESTTLGQNISAYAGVGQQDTGTATQTMNPANRRRVSEGGVQLGPDGQPLNQGNMPGMQPGMPNPIGPGVAGVGGVQMAPGIPPGFGALPGQVPGQPLPGQIPGQPFPGQMQGQPFPGQQSQFPGAAPSTGNSSYGSSTVGNYGSFGSPSPTQVQPPNLPGQPGYPQMQGGVFAGQPGPPANSQTGGVPAYPTMPGANGVPPNYPQPGMSFNPQQQGAAAALINGLLTSPRPGGLQGAGAAQQTGATIGGGIAGVASKAEGEGIMVYADHTDFNEWEFIWDPTKWKPPPNPLQGAAGTPVQQLGTTPSNSLSGMTPASQLGSSPQNLQQTTQPGVSSGFGMGTGVPDVRGGRQ